MFFVAAFSTYSFFLEEFFNLDLFLAIDGVEQFTMLWVDTACFLSQNIV
jgi:hypothetical protein